MPRALRLLRILPLLVVLMATAPSAAAQVWSFSHTGNIVTWTVPESGTYRVIATGAQGASANPSHVGGRGARIEGEFDFVAGQVLQIAVGGQGTASHVLIDNAGNGGGGGGTFLVSDDDSPLLIAGGGGGTRSGVSQDGTDASITETAWGSSFDRPTYIPFPQATGGAGGIAWGNSNGSGGAGFFGDGERNVNYASAARSWANGMTGGTSLDCGNAPGGFGGGGAGNGCFGGGGGGGYSGGAGGVIAGGGSSFNAGANPVAVAGVGYGDGSLTIILWSVPLLEVTPSTDYTATGPQGGPFTGTPTSYTVQNARGGTLDWTVTGPSWLTFSSASGSLGAVATETVDMSVNTADPLAQTAGIHSGTITFTNTATGEMVTRTATLTVEDVTPPTISGMPADISVPTDPGEPTAVVTWTSPTASDNVDGPITPSRIEGPASGSAFPVGVPTITYEAVDTAGNRAEASFTVTVTLRPSDPGMSDISAAPPTITANGADIAVITVNIRDDTGGLLGRGGDDVAVFATLGTLLGPVADNGDGTYTINLQAGFTHGTAEITATVNGDPIGGNAQVELLPDADAIAEAFTETTRAFLQRRMDRVIASEPRSHRLDRRREAAPGLSFAVSADIQGPDMATRFDIAGMLGQRPTGGLDIGAVEGGIPSRNVSFSMQSISQDRRWHLWAEGQYARYLDDTGTLGRRDGEFGIAHIGGDYLVNDRLSMGLMGSLDMMSHEGAGGTQVSGQGWMLGPYASVELADNLFLTARAAWGESANRARVDVYDDGNVWSGDFSTQRALARVTLSGVHEHHRMVLRPQIDLAWMEERQRNYTVSDGGATVDIDGITTSLGRLSLSTEAEWPIRFGGGALRAFGVPTLAWDFAGTGELAGHDMASGSVELGLRTTERSHWRGEASVRVDGIGQADFSGVTFRLGADRRF